MSRVGERVSITIPKELYERAKRYVEESGGSFGSVEELVEFVLREVLSEEEEYTLTPEEEEKIKERLRSLGYI